MEDWIDSKALKFRLEWEEDRNSKMPEHWHRIMKYIKREYE
jgi:hypothetical protein